MIRLVLRIAVVSSALLWAQQPSTDTEESPTPAYIAGTVVDVTTQEPVAKARVAVQETSPRAEPGLATRTDANGRFSISGVKPGRYRLNVNRRGFVAATGADAGSLRGGELQLSAGSSVDDIVLGLRPAAIITGTVVDEDGEPFEGLAVVAMQYKYFEDHLRLMGVGSAQTDDRGRYRMFGLAPGDYYIRSDASALRIDASWYVSPADELAVSYKDMYYPNGADSSEALPVSASADAETVGIDMRMIPSPAAVLSGVVIDQEDGQPAVAGTVWIFDRTKQGPQFGRQVQSQVSPSGAFQLTGVRPGSYRLEAMAYGGPTQRYGFADIEVADRNITDLRLIAQNTFSVDAEIRFEGDAERPSDIDPLARLAPVGPFMMRWGKAERIDANTTRFSQLVPDSYQVRTHPAGYYLKSARYDGRDVLDEPVYVQPGRGEFSLVLSANGAVVNGEVADNDGPVAGVRTVLIPNDRTRTQLYKVATTDQFGQFEIRDIAPGGYKIFAWQEIEYGFWLDPNVVAEVEALGRRIDVEEGDLVEIDLDAIADE